MVGESPTAVPAAPVNAGVAVVVLAPLAGVVSVGSGAVVSMVTPRLSAPVPKLFVWLACAV
jgi:hypothetical protein